MHPRTNCCLASAACRRKLGIAMGAVNRQGADHGAWSPSANVRPIGATAAFALIFCAVIAAMMCAPRAYSATLYRCNGDQGETVFASHVGHYKGCKLISGIADSAPRARRNANAAGRFVVSEATPIATTQSRAPEFVPAAYAPPQDVKANPAVITITPLQANNAPVVRTLPSPDAGVLQIGKPWPMSLLDAVATDLLPSILAGHALDPRAAPVTTPSAPSSTRAMAAQANASIALPLADHQDAGKLATATQPAVQVPRHGAVYKISRADGSIEYTNIAARAQGANAQMLFTYLIRCFACDVHSRVDWNAVALHLDAYNDDIRTAAAQTGVGEALLRAVIHAESGFNPRALSYKGAQGLMQLMPGTASDLGVINAFDVAQNIRGGAQYLAALLRDFNGDVSLAAAAYNAGEAAVRKYKGVPPYDETQVYVKRVALLRERYLKALYPASFAAATGSR